MKKANPSSGIHPRRRTIRLQDYDYSQPGAYFITTVIRERKAILGQIHDQMMQLSQAGKIVHQSWLNLPHHFPGIQLDEFCIMPNHFHGIIIITTKRRGGSETRPYLSGCALSEIMRAFKSFSARRINLLRNTTGTPVWQRSYFEHVIRNDDDWDHIRSYILDNPRRWEEDAENPITAQKDHQKLGVQEAE